MNNPLKAVIVGGGHRSMIYAGLAKTNPEMLKIVGVVDPNEFRRNQIGEYFDIPSEYRFENVSDLVAIPKFADAAINGTMDHIHVATSIPLLKAGYDILLEKPFAVNEEEMRELISCAEDNGRKIMICFVLRYAPFYRRIKETVLSGEIGQIVNIQTVEHVSYHHMSTSHIRGKWRNEEQCHATMLLAKCCHDIDIMMWLMGDDAPAKVSSFGSLMQFRPENAPKGSGTRCLVDCPLVDTCLYSAKRIFISTTPIAGHSTFGTSLRTGKTQRSRTKSSFSKQAPTAFVPTRATTMSLTIRVLPSALRAVQPARITWLEVQRFLSEKSI